MTSAFGIEHVSKAYGRVAGKLVPKTVDSLARKTYKAKRKEAGGIGQVLGRHGPLAPGPLGMARSSRQQARSMVNGISATNRQKRTLP